MGVTTNNCNIFLGKGLGKNEDGISKAIRPKLKFDNAGIGHDQAEQFTYHWWENVYNQAANNINVSDFNFIVFISRHFDVIYQKIVYIQLLKIYSLKR